MNQVQTEKAAGDGEEKREAERLNGLARELCGEQRELEREISLMLSMLTQPAGIGGVAHEPTGDEQARLGRLVREREELRVGAEEKYAEALARWRRSGTRDGAGLAETLTGLGVLHVQMQRAEEAERELSEALAVRRRLEPTEEAELLDAFGLDFPLGLERLSRGMKEAGRLADARRYGAVAAKEYRLLWGVEDWAWVFWLHAKAVVWRMSVEQWPWRWIGGSLALAAVSMALWLALR